MDEARRFLRYVAPGITAALELLALVVVSGKVPAASVWEELQKANTASVIAAFLASGVVGHFLAAVHHCLVMIPAYGIDHTDFVRHKDLQPKMGSDAATGARRAWQLVTAAWHERAESSLRIKGAIPRAATLADLMHGAGAGLVGALFAVAGWLIMCRYHVNAYAVLLAVAFLGVHALNYFNVRNHCREFVEHVLKLELT